MKIALIGPVYPYRGGIAHYTGLMAKGLLKKHEVSVISYKLQYPKILYPGETQTDFQNDTFKVNGAQFLLNTINPFSSIQTARVIQKIKADLVIFQWWHPFFAPCYWFLLKLLKKHCKQIFICHNVLPHEKFGSD